MTKEDDFFRCRVAILGLGLMGGSLALALRGKCALLLGVDPDPGVLKMALARGILDRAASNPADLLKEADLIVLATPVTRNLALLGALGDLHPGGAMVLDLSSTKVQIVAAMEKLPESFDPLGGHPICGKERGGLANAEAGLFLQAPFVLTALARSSSRVKRIAEELVRAIGAHPIWLDAESHDRWAARTSHLPYLVANTLAALTPEQAGLLAGPGLRSTIRLAPTPFSMMGDILATNRENLLEAAAAFRERLQLLEGLLASGEMAELEKNLGQGAEAYQRLAG